MEVVSWLTTHWLDVLQSIGIISGFVFTAHTIRRDAEARRISYMLDLAKQHSALWGELSRSELSRINDERAVLDTKPLSHEEQRFVTALILHLDAVHRAVKAKMLVSIEGLEKDVRQFFARPIPKAVWDSVKHYQNKDFVAFVENCINGESSR